VTLSFAAVEAVIWVESASQKTPLLYMFS